MRKPHCGLDAIAFRHSVAAGTTNGASCFSSHHQIESQNQSPSSTLTPGLHLKTPLICWRFYNFKKNYLFCCAWVSSESLKGIPLLSDTSHKREYLDMKNTYTIRLKNHYLLN